MNKTTRILLGALTSIALVAPTVALAGSAQASDESTHTMQRAKPKAKQKLKLSAKKGYIHYSLTTDTVTVTAKGFKKGKVAFAIDGVAAGKVKLKKRKATLTIPSSIAIGDHVVTAKLKKKKAKVKIVSYNSTMTLSTTAVTVNRATNDAPTITGQLIYKGQAANQGWVDAYNDDGSLTVGSDSPDLLGPASVDPGGAFQIYTHDYLDFAPGTYTMRAFFEYDAGYDEYLFGTPVTVTVI